MVLYGFSITQKGTKSVNERKKDCEQALNILCRGSFYKKFTEIGRIGV